MKTNGMKINEMTTDEMTIDRIRKDQMELVPSKSGATIKSEATKGDTPLRETASFQRRKEAVMRTCEEELKDEGLDSGLRELLELAQKGLAGDNGVRDEIILALADASADALDGSTALTTIGQEITDPVELARKTLLKSVYGDSAAMQTLGRRMLLEKERELAGSNPSALERIMTEQTALCWLKLQYFEQRYAARLNRQPQDRLGFQKEEFYQKQVARAQKQLESSLKTLALIRRLQLPQMQINVAEKQVNFGSGQASIREAQVNVMST